MVTTENTAVIDVRVRFTPGSNQCMVYPKTQSAKDWVDENVGIESWQWLGDGFAVDVRYVEHLVAGMQDAGLNVEGL